MAQTTDKDPDIIAQIKKMGAGSFLDVRELEDGTIVGLGRLLFTTAIYIDLDIWGWGRRYCFEDSALAQEQYQRLQSGDDIPQGWVAQRGQVS